MKVQKGPILFPSSEQDDLLQKHFQVILCWIEDEVEEETQGFVRYVNSER